MKIKITLLILLLMTLCSQSAFSQNAYLNAKNLASKDTDKLIEKLESVINDPIYTASLKEEELDGLKTFLSFLKNPFDNSIDFKKLDIETSIKRADSIRETKEATGMADEDGDGVMDKDDLCPSIAGTIFSAGCPETDDNKELFDKYKDFNQSVTELKDIAAANFEELSLVDASEFSSNSAFTSVVDGLAKFLVDRTKKEVALTFFENFNDRLNTELEIKFNENGNDITVKVNPSKLMPNTYLLLESSESYAIPSLGDAWITAFKKDLDNLPLNILAVLDASPEFIASNIGHYTLVIGNLIKELKEGSHPHVIIENLSKEFNNSQYRIDQYLKMFNLISSNIIKSEGNTLEWANFNDINGLTALEKKYFFGWIYQEGRSKEIIESNSIIDVIYSDTQLLIKEIDHIKDIFNEIKSTANTNSDDYILKYSQLIETTIESLNQLNSLSFIDETKFGLKSEEFLNKLLPLSKDLNNFLNSFNKKSYGESLLYTLSFVKNITGVESDNKLIKQISFYGNFLVDMVNAAESEDDEKVEVTAILDKYALPVSSYRIKRQSNWAIDLNAYPGISGNYEFSDSDSFSLGITAPIGFSFSKKNNEKKNESASHSVFLSVIDIGAPFSFRLTNDEAEGLPEDITWKQIFAPGLFYVHGFRNSPFAISAGLQYSPLLRKIEENNVLDDKNIVKFSIGLVVDIPMFNIARSSN